METNYLSFESNSGRFIAWNQEVLEDFPYFWFEKDGTMVRPATSSEWAYALTWKKPIQNIKVVWPSCYYYDNHPVTHQEADEEYGELPSWFFRFGQHRKKNPLRRDTNVVAYENSNGKFCYGIIKNEDLASFTETLDAMVSGVYVHDDKSITGHGILTTDLYGPIFKCLPGFGLYSSEEA